MLYASADCENCELYFEIEAETIDVCRNLAYVNNNGQEIPFCKYSQNPCKVENPTTDNCMKKYRRTFI